MGKEDRLCNKIELFANLFWALGIVLLTPDPSLHLRTGSMTI